MKRYISLYEYKKSKVIPPSSPDKLTGKELKYWNDVLLPVSKTAGFIKYDDLTDEDKEKIDKLLIAFKKNFHKIMGSIDEENKHDPKKRLSLLDIKYVRIFREQSRYLIGFSIGTYLYLFSTKEDYDRMKHEVYPHRDLGEYGVWFA